MTTKQRYPRRLAMMAAPLGSLSAGAALAAGPDNVTALNKDKVAEALGAWMNGTGNITDLFADSIRWTIVGGSLIAGTTTGKRVLIDKILQPFAARFAESSDKFRPVAIRGIYADGDVVVAMFDGQGTANDGKPYANTYAWFLTFRDGRVAEATAFFDSFAFDAFWRRVAPKP
ncbi:nuclear transport factor 2 family protein [Acidisoma cellulosilytica]|uniref:Nuclear transport factor 2 family protein n=1 Tax=Acidisoma cellulosilyticum TaxID=2802395 RepID=A0A963Z4V5_9PROT|nr:nuclear transport factor 2 family protein [Acidisoma cellulosilyticum]MCB8882793.1 nuclear transport factor 2 family protein [Acidisoma cellulosilyticum]